MIVGALLIGLSFYLTNSILNYLKEKDPIMKEIKYTKEKYQTKSENAEIIGNSIISGKKGKEIDYQKSFSKMKKYGSYNEALTTLKEIKPVISIEDNYDKYLIGGNKKNRKIALVFPISDIEENNFKNIINILETKKISGTFFIDGTILEKNTNFIKKYSNQEYEILSYKNSFHPSFFKTSVYYLETITKKETKYCYTESDNDEILKLCSKINHHTVKPTIIIKKNLYQEVKQNLANSIIISIRDNKYIEKELPIAIDYIKAKDYKLVNLKKLLSE